MKKTRRHSIPLEWQYMVPGDSIPQLGPDAKIIELFEKAEKQGLRFAFDTEGIQHESPKWRMVIRLPDETGERDE